MTTSTVYRTETYTITSCAPEVTECPSKLGQVTTRVIVDYTTVCPVGATPTGKAERPASSVDVPKNSIPASTSIATLISASRTPSVASVPASSNVASVPASSNVASPPPAGKNSTSTNPSVPAASTNAFKDAAGSLQAGMGSLLVSVIMGAVLLL